MDAASPQPFNVPVDPSQLSAPVRQAFNQAKRNGVISNEEVQGIIGLVVNNPNATDEDRNLAHKVAADRSFDVHIYETSAQRPVELPPFEDASGQARRRGIRLIDVQVTRPSGTQAP